MVWFVILISPFTLNEIRSFPSRKHGSSSSFHTCSSSSCDDSDRVGAALAASNGRRLTDREIDALVNFKQPSRRQFLPDFSKKDIYVYFPAMLYSCKSHEQWHSCRRIKVIGRRRPINDWNFPSTCDENGFRTDLFFCFVFRIFAKAMRALDEKQRIFLVQPNSAGRIFGRIG